MNEITTQPQSLKSLISSDKIKEQMSLAMPKHMTADRMARVAITALTKNPKLLNCTPESFMRCMMDLSAMGLEPDGRRAYLIPYKTECTLIIDYKGLVELVRRNGDVKKIHADVVFQNDEFENNLGEVTKHQYSLTVDRGEVIAAYAMVEFNNGSKQFEVMTKSEIELIRQASQGKNQAPWVKHWNEMAKKTVFRRLTKWLTLSPEIRDHIDKIDSQEFRDVTPQKVEVVETPINPFLDSEEVKKEVEFDDLKLEGGE